MLTLPIAKSISSLKVKFVDFTVMFFVSLFSLLLLVYVGMGEGQRTFASFLCGKMVAQGEIIQNSMSSHLQAGLPLTEFVGFINLASQIMESDRTISRIAITDRSGKTIFSSMSKENDPSHSADTSQDLQKSTKLKSNDRFEASQTDNHYLVMLPLRNKFEITGGLWVMMPRTVVSETLGVALLPLILSVTVISLFFSALISLTQSTCHIKRNRMQQKGLAVCFLSTAVVVLVLLISFYSEGAQSKARALAVSLGDRISALAQAGVAMDDVRGIENAFIEYRDKNKDIQAIGLLNNNLFIIHTDPDKLGTAKQISPGTFEYIVDLSGDVKDEKYSVYVSLPSNIVFQAIAISAKNFIVLFFATALISALFLQIANALQSDLRTENTSIIFSDSALEKGKPILFLAVFVDNLSVSFLPQLIRSYSDIDHAPAIMTSVAFMAHFLFFAAVLIPAGKMAQRIGPKLLMCTGAMSVALGLGLLVTTESLALIVLSRVFSGLGQGILFIGVQLLVLTLTKATSSQNKASGIIVYNFNAGMLSGIAIGSLLNLYMGSQGVFIFGFIVILLLAIYIYTVVPPISIMKVSGHDKTDSRLWKILSDFEFLRVILLIGIPTKAVMTGVIIFGLPIIMSNFGYESDEIGQSIMFYALGVLLSNHLVSISTGKNYKPKTIMNAGMLIGSFGLASIGIIGTLSTEWMSAHRLTVMLMVLVGALVIGLGHGAINAPVVTYIANSSVSESSGMVHTTSLYRLLERVGHILGPMLMGQLLILTGQSVRTLLWVGIAMLILAIFSMIDFEFEKNVSAH